MHTSSPSTSSVLLYWSSSSSLVTSCFWPGSIIPRQYFAWGTISLSFSPCKRQQQREAKIQINLKNTVLSLWPPKGISSFLLFPSGKALGMAFNVVYNEDLKHSSCFISLCPTQTTDALAVSNSFFSVTILGLSTHFCTWHLLPIVLLFPCLHVPAYPCFKYQLACHLHWDG